MSKPNKQLNNLIGALNINKPAGPTSHDVVKEVRKIIKNASATSAKVGHAGTLDPFATGVLLVLVGPANRLMEYIHLLPKTYQTEITLGAISDTDDLTGKITRAGKTPGVNEKTPDIEETHIQKILKGFVGNTKQTPPSYSAIKIKGKKAYEAARRGSPLKLPSRNITIHNINILKYKYPILELEVTCNSGTYIRSLARDIGTALHTGAYVSKLIRTAIGPVKQFSDQKFNIENSIQLNQLTSKNLLSHLLPPEMLIAHLPSVNLTNANVAQLINGQPIGWGTKLPANQPLALFNKKHSLVGIGAYNPKTVLLSPTKIIITPN